MLLLLMVEVVVMMVVFQLVLVGNWWCGDDGQTPNTKKVNE